MPVESLRQISAFHKDPKFGRLLLVSLLVHGLVWVAFTADLFGTKTRPKPPIYYVDLIHKPVLNPQAGRPDPRPAKKPEAAKVKRTVQTAPPAVQKKPEPAVKPLVKPVQASQPKPNQQQSKPTPVQPKAEKAVAKVLTQEETSIPVVKKEPKKVSPKEETPKKVEPKKIEKKTPPTPPKPTVAASTKSILSNVLNAKKREGE